MRRDSFAPNPARARSAASELDRHLLSSLDHLAQACAGQVTIDRRGVDRLAGTLAAGGTAHPLQYGIHFDLLDRIAEEDERGIADAFALLADFASGGTIVALDEVALGETLADIYRRNIDSDVRRELSLIAPPAASVATATSRLSEARALIQGVASALAEEVGHVTRQVILAAEAPGAPYPFYGGSSFFLWGGVFLNPARHTTPYETAETLVHEAAHTLLTALAREEPLVRNPRDARFRSPVRQDPRPMEGIYHATFVLARTCFFHRAVAAADLPRSIRVEATELAERDAHHFDDGFNTVMAHADLSELGRVLIEDTSRYIREGS
ncbi:MAG: HEXXH motif-containing putative peptide modification protein [Dongiaceae bacterium]